MDLVIAYWPLFVSYTLVIMWLIRLESKVLYLENDRTEHWEKIDLMQTKLNEIAESLARLEGRLQNK